MITNKDLLAYGRSVQEAQFADRRIALMARVSSIRDSIRQYQTTLLQLEHELEKLNEQHAKLVQTRLPFNEMYL